MANHQTPAETLSATAPADEHAASNARRASTYSELIVQALSRHGEREAFVDGDRRVTYAQAARHVSQICHVLAAHGVGRGDGVATMSPNAPEVWLVQAATYLLGAHWSGLHPLGSVDDHAFLCREAQISVLVVHPDVAEHAALVVDRAPDVEHVLSIGPSELGDDLLALCERAPARPLEAGPAELEDVAWLQFTGGTTGQPKGVALTQGSCAHQAQTWLMVAGLPDRPRYLAASPITHAALLAVLPTLLRGGTVVLQRAFDPEAWLRTVAEERVSVAVMVPTMVGAVLDAMESTPADLSSMRALLYGAAPMAPSRIEQAYELIGPVLRQIYAASEANGTISVLTPEDHDPAGRPELLSSCGQPAVGVRVAILDPAGRQLPAGEVGEICVQSAAVMSGYWRRPDLTADTLAHGWLHTGDMGYVDDAGYLYIVDRKKDMIISGGFNVYPREIEDVLLSHPSLCAAAVIGVPDERWGEAVRAFVQCRPGSEVDVEELRVLVRERKGSHYAPKAIEVVASLPQTPVGKIDKKALRAPYWADRGRQVN